MDFDYNTIVHKSSQVKLHDQTFTLIQTFTLDTMIDYIRTTIFTLENKIIHSSEEFQSRITKKAFIPKEKIINKKDALRHLFSTTMNNDVSIFFPIV